MSILTGPFHCDRCCAWATSSLTSRQTPPRDPCTSTSGSRDPGQFCSRIRLTSQCAPQDAFLPLCGGNTMSLNLRKGSLERPGSATLQTPADFCASRSTDLLSCLTEASNPNRCSRLKNELKQVCSAKTMRELIFLQPVCTTEIGRLALKYDELKSKGCKLATLSCDPVSRSKTFK